jgi:hypothetical protein
MHRGATVAARRGPGAEHAGNQLTQQVAMRKRYRVSGNPKENGAEPGLSCRFHDLDIALRSGCYATRRAGARWPCQLWVKTAVAPSAMATAVIIFGNHGLTKRLGPGLIRPEMGAAINPVTWTSISAGCGSPTGLRSKQACLRCACLVANLARLRVRKAGFRSKAVGNIQKGDWVVIAPWLVQLRARLLLPADAPAQQSNATRRPRNASASAVRG